MSTELKVPELWYDLYARFMPGFSFMAACWYFVLGVPRVPTIIELILVVGGGYIAAMLTQPVASRVTSVIEGVACKLRKVDDDFVDSAQAKVGNNSPIALLLFKMHGEVTFFVQLALLSQVIFLIQSIRVETAVKLSLWPLLFSVVNLIWALEVADRRIKRAKRFLKFADVSKLALETK